MAGTPSGYMGFPWERCMRCTSYISPETEICVLPCLHALCAEPCVDRFIQGCTNQSDGKIELTCRRCAKLVPSVNYLNGRVKLKDFFPKKPRLEDFVLKCENCVLNHPAKIYCTECKKNMCKECSEHHSIQRVSIKHKCEALPDEPSVEQYKSSIASWNTCQFHHKKELVKLCFTCQKKLCETCIETHSPSHFNSSIAELVADAGKQLDLLRATEDLTRWRVSMLEERLTTLEQKHFESFESEMRITAERISQEILQRCENYIIDGRHICELTKRQLKQKIRFFTDAANDTSNLISVIENVKEIADDIGVINVAKKASAWLHDVGKIKLFSEIDDSDKPDDLFGSHYLSSLKEIWRFLIKERLRVESEKISECSHLYSGNFVYDYAAKLKSLSDPSLGENSTNATASSSSPYSSSCSTQDVEIISSPSVSTTNANFVTIVGGTQPSQGSSTGSVQQHLPETSAQTRTSSNNDYTCEQHAPTESTNESHGSINAICNNHTPISIFTFPYHNCIPTSTTLQNFSAAWNEKENLAEPIIVPPNLKENIDTQISNRVGKIYEAFAETSVKQNVIVEYYLGDHNYCLQDKPSESSSLALNSSEDLDNPSSTNQEVHESINKRIGEQIDKIFDPIVDTPNASNSYEQNDLGAKTDERSEPSVTISTSLSTQDQHGVNQNERLLLHGNEKANNSAFLRLNEGFDISAKGAVNFASVCLLNVTPSTISTTTEPHPETLPSRPNSPALIPENVLPILLPNQKASSKSNQDAQSQSNPQHIRKSRRLKKKKEVKDFVYPTKLRRFKKQKEPKKYIPNQSPTNATTTATKRQNLPEIEEGNKKLCLSKPEATANNSSSVVAAAMPSTIAVNSSSKKVFRIKRSKDSFKNIPPRSSNFEEEKIPEQQNHTATLLNPTIEAERRNGNDDFCSLCLSHGMEAIVHCKGCPRVFHLNCHIPPIKKSTFNAATWHCNFHKTKEDMENEIYGIPGLPYGRNRLLIRKNIREFHLACKFLTEVYKVLHIPMRRWQFVTKYYYKFGEIPQYLNSIRERLCLPRQDELGPFTCVRAFLYAMRKMFRQVFRILLELDEHKEEVLTCFKEFENLVSQYYPRYLGIFTSLVQN